MYVVVGRIGRAHGLRGDLSIEVRTDEPEVAFAPGQHLKDELTGRELVVAGSKWHSGRLLVSFEGYPDRTAAETLRGMLLQVDRPEGAVPQDDDEYYDYQLVGLTALDIDGAVIGTVTEVVHLPGQDLLGLDIDGRSVLVPFVESIVPQVNIEQRTVLITPPQGLLTLEDEPEQ